MNADHPENGVLIPCRLTRPKGNPKWDPTLFEALAREIDKGGRYWSVPCMVAWIREGYGKAIPQSTVWYHVRHLNYSYKSARPHPAKGDPAQHQAFKKGGSAAPSCH